MGCNCSSLPGHPNDLEQEKLNKSKNNHIENVTSLEQMSVSQFQSPRMLPDAYLRQLCTAINRAFFLKDDDWRKNTAFASEHDMELKCVYQFMSDKVQNQTLNPKIPYVISFQLSRNKKKFIFAVLGEIYYYSAIKNLEDEPRLYQLKEFQKRAGPKWYSYSVKTDFAFFSITPFFQISCEIKLIQNQSLTPEVMAERQTKLKTLFAKIYKQKSTQEIEQMISSNTRYEFEVFVLNENMLKNNILNFTNILHGSDLNDQEKEQEIFGENPEIESIEVYELNSKVKNSVK